MRHFMNKNKGPLLVLAAQALAALIHGIAKFLQTNAGKIEPLQILFVRMVVTVAACSFHQWRTGSKEFPLGPTKLRTLLVLRAIGGVFGAIGFYYSLQALPLAEATVISFLAPLTSCCASAMLVRSSFGRTERFATLIAFIGIILVTQPDFMQNWLRGATSVEPDSTEATGGGILSRISSTALAPRGSQEASDHSRANGYSVGIAFALLGALGGACALTMISIIGKRAHPVTVTNYFGVAMIVFSAITFILVPSVHFDFYIGWTSWILLMVVGICGFLCELLMTAGLAAETSSKATYMIYSQVLFALFIDEVFWHKIPDIMSLFGSLLVLFGVILVAAAGNQNRSTPRKGSIHGTGYLEVAGIQSPRLTDIRIK